MPIGISSATRIITDILHVFTFDRAVLPSWVSIIAILVPPSTGPCQRTVNAAMCVLVPVLSAEHHSIMEVHAVAKGGEGVVESANCQHISVSWTNLELIIDGHIGLLVIVGHGYLQLVRLLAGQLMKGVKTNPTLAIGFKSCLILRERLLKEVDRVADFFSPEHHNWGFGSTVSTVGVVIYVFDWRRSTHWDVAFLPSFPRSGVAPDSFVTVRISAEVVFALISEFVFVRLLFRPLLAFVSRNCLCYVSLVIFSVFTILSLILTVSGWSVVDAFSTVAMVGSVATPATI